MKDIILNFLPCMGFLLQLHVSPANLQRAWTATRRVSKDDWLEWLRRLSIELLKESPSPALRYHCSFKSHCNKSQ